eukprot:7391012-Prymnesium_polylepis.3
MAMSQHRYSSAGRARRPRRAQSPTAPPRDARPPGARMRMWYASMASTIARRKYPKMRPAVARVHAVTKMSTDTQMCIACSRHEGLMCRIARMCHASIKNEVTVSRAEFQP